MDNFNYTPAVIRVPSWAMDDADLEALANKLREVEAEIIEDGREPDERSTDCLADIITELKKRGRPITLGNGGEDAN